MPLNTEKNLYSVAPVGHVIVIGRSVALRGGLTREQALNLLSWLIIATGAKPEEIGAIVADASSTGKSVKPALAVMPQVKAPETNDPKQFMGEIDKEEQAAIDAALAAAEEKATQNTAQTVAVVAPQLPTVGQPVMRPQHEAPATNPKVVPVDGEAIAGAWGKVGG